MTLRGDWVTAAILTAVTAVTLVVILPQLKAEPATCPREEQVTAAERDLLEQVNAYRAAQALATLTPEPALARAAQLMANDLAQSASLAHVDSQGRELVARAVLCGLGNVDQGEVLARGYLQPADTLAGWQASPSHNRVLLNPLYTQAGVARRWGPWRSQSSVPYWVVELSN